MDDWRDRDRQGLGLRRQRQQTEAERLTRGTIPPKGDLGEPVDTACPPRWAPGTRRGEPCGEPGVRDRRWMERKMRFTVPPRAPWASVLSSRACTHGVGAKAPAGVACSWGAGRAGTGTRGTVPSLPPSGAVLCNPDRQSERASKARWGGRLDDASGTELKRLAPGVCLRSPLRRSAPPPPGCGVLDPGHRTGGEGRGQGGGRLGMGALGTTPTTAPGGRHHAGARVRLRMTADASA